MSDSVFCSLTVGVLELVLLLGFLGARFAGLRLGLAVGVVAGLAVSSSVLHAVDGAVDGCDAVLPEFGRINAAVSTGRRNGWTERQARAVCSHEVLLCDTAVIQ